MSNTDFSKNLRTGKELLLPKDLIGLKAAIGLPTFFSSPAMACVISSGLRWGKLWDVRMLRMVIWILGSAQLLSTLCLASLGEEVGEAILGGGEAVKGDDGDDGLTMQDFSRFASRCSAAAGRCSPAEAVRFNASLGEEMGEAILSGGAALKGDDGPTLCEAMQDFSRFAGRCSAAAGRCSPAEAVRFTSPVIITFLISVGSVGFCGLELSLSISGSTALSPCMMYRILSASCPPMRRTDMAGDAAGCTL